MNYEVIKFIEHGNHCRPVMDSVPGELLLYRLKRCPDMDKQHLFRWIRELSQQLEQFHRCRAGQNYRYVNPYSVLVTREEKLLLLDLEAESNAFVLRNLQTRAMRNHFIKPVFPGKEQTKISFDLYGYAKTIQFLLANTHVEPSLTRREEYRLEKIIRKCLHENSKKQYENFRQIQKELPAVNPQEQRKGTMQKAVIAGFAVILFLSLWKIRGLTEEKQQLQEQTEYYVQKQAGESKEAKDAGEKTAAGGDGLTEGSGRKEKSGEDAGGEETEEQKAEDQETNEWEKAEGPQDGMDKLEEETERLQTYLLKNTAKDNQEIIEQGETIQRELLRYLAAAYDREEMTEKAWAAYAELCRVEVQETLLETAYLRRLTLEMELDKEDVLQTGKEAMERLPDSRGIAKKCVEILLEKTVPREDGEEDFKRILARFPELEEDGGCRELKERYGMTERQEEGEAGAEEKKEEPEMEQ